MFIFSTTHSKVACNARPRFQNDCRELEFCIEFPEFWMSKLTIWWWNQLAANQGKWIFMASNFFLFYFTKRPKWFFDLIAPRQKMY